MDHRTIVAIPTPIAGSSHCAPVIRMAKAPDKMPTFEIASPKLCISRLRRLNRGGFELVRALSRH